MSEYLCLTVVSKHGESSGEFSLRLSTFWTVMLRNHPDDFEKVYAEATAFEELQPGVLSRQYLIESDVALFLEKSLGEAGFRTEPLDSDDTYSQYEAVPPEWMQIEH